MKKILTYIAASLALAACQSETIVDEQVQEADNVLKVEMPKLVRLGDAGRTTSRSSLNYDKFNGTYMHFAWNDADKVGVFAASQEHPQVLEMKLKSGGENELRREMELVDPALEFNIKANTAYVAFFPYADHSGDYLIPVDYTKQTQASNVDMSLYYEASTPEQKATYLASEKAASAHLGAKDFLCSPVVTTTHNKGALFPMQRMGVVLRFFLKVPANEVFDELQLITPKDEFTLKANMNVSSQSLKSTKSQTTVSLQFNSFDFSLDGENKPFELNKTNFDYYNNKYTGYIIAYMMIAPIDLKDVNCMLYLVGHDKANPEAKHYYKASNLSAPNYTFAGNDFFQWSPTTGPDQPIEFKAVEIQQWEQDKDGFKNEGGGTGSW